MWTTCHSCELHVLGEVSLSTGAYFKCSQSFYRWIWGLMVFLSLLSLLRHIWSLSSLVMPYNEATGSIPTLLVHSVVNPQHCSSLPFIHPGEERHYESTVSYSTTQPMPPPLEPGLINQVYFLNASIRNSTEECQKCT